jgi:hypothetical protein
MATFVVRCCLLVIFNAFALVIEPLLKQRNRIICYNIAY